MVPIQDAQRDTGVNEPLLLQPALASSTTETAEPQSPPQVDSPPQSLSPQPSEEIRPRSPNRPQSQVLYAEILRTAPSVIAERQQARGATPSPKNGSPYLNGVRNSPTINERQSPAPAQNLSLSPLSDRSFTTSEHSSSGASYTLPQEPQSQQPQRPTGFKERLMKEPLPDVKLERTNGPVTNQVNSLRALSPETPETNF